MAKRRVRNEDQQVRLDAALADSFPASDPVAMLSPAPARKVPPSRPPRVRPKPKRPKR